MKGIRSFVLVSLIAVLLPASPASHAQTINLAPLGKTLSQVVEEYNAFQCPSGVANFESAVVPSAAENNTYVPIGDAQKQFIHVITNPENEITMVGVVLVKSVSPEFEHFVVTADCLMQIVFPELSQAERNNMIAKAIIEGTNNGKFEKQGRHTVYTGKYLLDYIVKGEGEREIMLLKAE